MISNADVRKMLGFENANSECKRMIRTLKTRSEPIDGQIQNTADIQSLTLVMVLG